MMMLALGKRNSSLKCKYCTLGTSITRLKYTAYWMQQSTAPEYLFDSTTREVDNTNVTLGHSPLEATGKELGKEEVQFNCFDRSCIRGFGNAWHQGYGKTRWRDPLSGTR